MMNSYAPLSVWLSMNTLRPARCTCPHRQVPPAGLSACDNPLRCRSRSARRAGWRCNLCTSGCYIWGWTRCSRGSRGSFQGPSYPPKVLQCWQEALIRRGGSFTLWVYGTTGWTYGIGIHQKQLLNQFANDLCSFPLNYGALSTLWSQCNIYFTFHIQISHGFNTSCNEFDLPRILWPYVAHQQKMFGPWEKYIMKKWDAGTGTSL